MPLDAAFVTSFNQRSFYDVFFPMKTPIEIIPSPCPSQAARRLARKISPPYVVPLSSSRVTPHLYRDHTHSDDVITRIDDVIESAVFTMF